MEIRIVQVLEGSQASTLTTRVTISQMARPNVKRRHSDLHFESVARISSLPIVENSINIAGNVYDRIKRSNSLMNWSLGTAEQSLAIATASAKPAICVLNGPITTIDHLLCKGIDIVEQRVPAVHLPPHLMYCNAREYVNNKIVRPVLMRAGSMKQIGSQAANAAADRLDGALTVADKYVDHYLPADPTDKVADVTTPEPVSKTTRTMKHGARFSRKLQKRLTKRTLAEARALKDQGTECIHVLLYVAELVATDPKLALQKAKELWATLSLPEPENQARPASLEQLLVLLTRESARRVVHLMNGTSTLAAKTPRDLGRILVRVSHQLLAVADATLKMVPLIGKKDAVNAQMSVMRSAIERLNSTTNHLLEQFASFLAGRPGASKVTHAQSHQQNHNNHMSMSSNPPVNGIE
ncbi:lipid storage droplet-1 isoform X2 [Andrena cerasifolii]|uniref:lipid storage droplet-1 isoform X2 n=1 Tax=Andrena cerasifolii TaxID=2819439 RepID=UPI004038386C